MAARAAAARIPRLRLFSGPNCSLCDVRHNAGGFSPRLRARDDQHPGSWAGVLEEEICVLDPRTAHRRQGGSEGPMGRADGDRGAGEVEAGASGGYGGQPEGAIGQQPAGPLAKPTELQTQLPALLSVEEQLKHVHAHYLYFEHDFPGEPGYTFRGIYERATDAVLGDPEDECEDAVAAHPSRSRCFNCGSPEHILAACPDPISRPLVALSRQMHDFYRGTGTSAGSGGRLWAIEEWRGQRMRWLDEWQPGEVRGEGLREALGGDTHPWLENMMMWGYPPGWFSVEDPRDRVRAIIEGNDEPEVHAPDESFTELPLESTFKKEPESEVENELPSGKTSSPQVPRRWARYPPSFVYNGFALPMLRGTAPYLPHAGPLTLPPGSSPPPPPCYPPPPPMGFPPPPPSSSPPPPPPGSPPPLPPSLPPPMFRSRTPPSEPSSRSLPSPSNNDRLQKANRPSFTQPTSQQDEEASCQALHLAPMASKLGEHFAVAAEQTPGVSTPFVQAFSLQPYFRRYGLPSFLADSTMHSEDVDVGEQDMVFSDDE
ncbi:hypothetical protein HDZ31DRAFT_79312 [Schizophyllum fasciatum]